MKTIIINGLKQAIIAAAHDRNKKALHHLRLELLDALAAVKEFEARLAYPGLYNKDRDDGNPPKSKVTRWTYFMGQRQEMDYDQD